MDYLFSLDDLQCQHVRLVRIQAPLTFLIFTQVSWPHITLIFLWLWYCIFFIVSSQCGNLSFYFGRFQKIKKKHMNCLAHNVCVPEEWGTEAEKLFPEPEYIYSSFCLCLCVCVGGGEGAFGWTFVLVIHDKQITKTKTILFFRLEQRQSKSHLRHPVNNYGCDTKSNWGMKTEYFSKLYPYFQSLSRPSIVWGLLKIQSKQFPDGLKHQTFVAVFKKLS